MKQHKMEDQEIKKAIKVVINDLEKLYDVTADKIEYSDFHGFSYDSLMELLRLLESLGYRTDLRYAFEKFNKNFNKKYKINNLDSEQVEL